MLQTILFKKSSLAFIVMLLSAFINLAKAQNLTRASVTVSPTFMFFTDVQNEKPPLQELTITVSNVVATAETIVRAPDFFQLFTSPGSGAGKSLIITGNGTFKIFVGFAGSSNTGDFTGALSIQNDETSTVIVALKATVILTPTPAVSPAKLNGFTTLQGTLSAAKFFNLSITGIPVQGDQIVVVKAPSGYLVSIAGTPSTFVGAFVLTAQNGRVDSKVFVAISNTTDTGKIKGNVTISGTQINTATVFVSGTVKPKPQPAITTDKDSLVGFATTVFKASALQSYQLTASNLNAGLNVIVKAPAGYEISLTSNATVFSSQLTVLQNAGSINAPIFVRLKSQATAGTVTGVVQNSTGSLMKNVNVSGIVKPLPSLTVNPSSLTGFSAIQTQPSPVKTYTLTASNLNAEDVAIVTAPANYEVRQQGKAAFAASISVAQTNTATINTPIEVRIKADAVLGNVTGIIQNVIGNSTRTVSISGFVAAPFLSVSPSSLSFTAVKNQASAAKSYKVIASSLAPGVTVSAAASAAYELSLNSTGPFSATLNLQQNVANGVNTDVFVRLKPSAITGIVTGTVQHSVDGLSKTLNLSANASASFNASNKTNLTDGAVDNNNFSIKAYPNPFTDYVIIELAVSSKQNVQVKFSNSTGDLLFEKNIIAQDGMQQIELSLKEQIQGIYFIEVVGGEVHKTIKIYKQ